MLAFVTILLAFVFAVNADESYMEGALTELATATDKCMEQEKASADDFNDLVELKFPIQSHSAKCMMACLYEDYKTMTPEGTFDKASTIALFDKLKSAKPDLHDKFMKIIDVCQANRTAKIFDDRCETAAAMAGCVISEGRAMGLSKEALFGA